jgi:hypothetical protein
MNICSKPSDNSLVDAVRLYHDTYLYTNLFKQSVSVTCMCKRGCKDEWVDDRKNECADVC